VYTAGYKPGGVFPLVYMAPTRADSLRLCGAVFPPPSLAAGPAPQAPPADFQPPRSLATCAPPLDNGGVALVASYRGPLSDFIAGSRVHPSLVRV
jgi:hypothetical protein